MAAVPPYRIDRHGFCFVVSMQSSHVGDKLRVENQQHHFEIQVQAAFVQIDGAKKAERVVNRDCFGVQKTVCEKGNLHARVHQVTEVSAARPAHKL